MLKPYLCVACEKVIISVETVPSIIAIFSKIVVAVAAETDVPKNAVANKEWSIFCLYNHDDGDELKEYTHKVQIVYPDKTQFGDVSKTKFVAEAGKRSQVHIQVPVFPIGQTGKYTIRVWVEENERLITTTEFSVDVEIVRNQAPVPAVAQG